MTHKFGNEQGRIGDDSRQASEDSLRGLPLLPLVFWNWICREVKSWGPEQWLAIAVLVTAVLGVLIGGEP